MDRFELDPVQRTARVADRVVSLTPAEFSLLWFFTQHAGRVFSREELLEQVKGESYPATARSIDVRLSSLRRKLGPQGEQIETIRGQGYRFRAPASSRHTVALPAETVPPGDPPQ